MKRTNATWGNLPDIPVHPPDSKAGTVTTARRHHRFRLALSLGAALTLVAAILPGGALAASVRPKVHTPTWGPCPPPPPGTEDSGQQCATLSLPLDYHNPSGRKIQVAISRIKAAVPSERRGVLLTNPGGPGGAGLDLPRALKVLAPQSIFDEYDVIGFDPRGVGTSTPVTCGLTAEQVDQAFVPLTQPGGFAATTAFAQQVANGCASNSSDLLPFITTANTARDMDQIRLALGESKISYFAYSYGTYLGAVYASLYPNQTDRFVLDSSVDSTGIWRQLFREWGPGGAIRFPDFAGFAIANNDTYHLGTTPDAVQNTFVALLARVKQHPYTVPVGTGSGVVDDGTVLNDTLFREVTLGGLSDSDAAFAELARLWQLIKDAPITETPSAKPQPTSAKPLQETPVDNLAASGLAVTCDDAKWSRDPAKYERELNADIANYPLFGELGSNIWACAFWPNDPVEKPVALSSSGPSNILMIQNRRDPLTPYAGALKTRAALGNRARLVSVDQGGHGAAYLNLNACASDVATGYLVDGTFPAADTSCAAEAPAATSSATPAGKSAPGRVTADLRRRLAGLP